MAVLIELNDDRSETIQYDSLDYPLYIRRGILSHLFLGGNRLKEGVRQRTPS